MVAGKGAREGKVGGGGDGGGEGRGRRRKELVHWVGGRGGDGGGRGKISGQGGGGVTEVGTEDWVVAREMAGVEEVEKVEEEEKGW
ncbi:hypothetical protein CYMTET_12546 [Cymbomonas tetramitiformis]|uniref:Uncharacterized protein n=1 Tax=Cymbomonas tetramitiformis TaxID=36881 RepID=A0AAE0LBY6_9CHLO|nr:hypothetical protein CYMTET_12546 [Cymbomonas tetramitiformis]